ALRHGDRQGAPGVRPVRQRGAPADAAGWDVEGDPPQMAGPVRADARAARGAVRRLMDARALDDELARLAGAAERARATLLEMEREPGRQLIAMSTLEGGAAGRWAVANTALGLLWAWLELLDGVLASARTERGTRPRPSAARLDRVAALLQGPSLEVPQEDVPLDERDLRGGPHLRARRPPPP